MILDTDASVILRIYRNDHEDIVISTVRLDGEFEGRFSIEAVVIDKKDLRELIEKLAEEMQLEGSE